MEPQTRDYVILIAIDSATIRSSEIILTQFNLFRYDPSNPLLHLRRPLGSSPRANEPRVLGKCPRMKNKALWRVEDVTERFRDRPIWLVKFLSLLCFCCRSKKKVFKVFSYPDQQTIWHTKPVTKRSNKTHRLTCEKTKRRTCR